jgi:hypothetical protein
VNQKITWPRLGEVRTEPFNCHLNVVKSSAISSRRFTSAAPGLWIPGAGLGTSG